MSNQIQIIKAKWIIPIIPRKKVLEQSALVIQGDRIIDICQHDRVEKKYPQATIIDKSKHAILPGFINTHTHAAMSLFKGYADDLNLQEWLENRIWPAETQWVDRQFIREGTQLAICEMLLSGITCFNDMYYYPDVVANVAQECGIRACVGLIALEFPTVWANSVDEYLAKGLAVNDEIRQLSLVSAAFAPHSPYTVSDEALQKILTYADELQLPIHIHLHETKKETEQSGERPIQRLHKLGLFNPRLIAVHMVHLNEEDIELCAKQGVHVVHCPKSNAKLGNGIAPVTELLDAGVNVCLGADGSASNNTLDILNEAQFASLLAKSIGNNAQAIPAWQALEMATINGAKALNLDHSIGSLEKHKLADFIAFDLSKTNTTPVYDPISQIMYSGRCDQVSDVWVAGKHIVNAGQLEKINLSQVKNQAKQWESRIQTSKSPQ